MKQLVTVLKWLLNGSLFFTLFAFALNNQQDATLHFFFGRQWRLPMVLIVLGAFALGMTAGILAMVPRWWKQRRAANHAQKARVTAPDPADNGKSTAAGGLTAV
jgi:lipopolysaccharide assembly protein A